ncbi:hypothetical protein QTP70_021779, partial [Hemibagrus guttatus]
MKFQQRIQEKQKKVQELKQAVNTIKKKHSEVTELIRAQEKTELSRAERLLEQRALASGRQSPAFIRPDFDTSSITVPQHLSFDGVRNSLSDLKKRLEEFCEEEFNKIPP